MDGVPLNNKTLVIKAAIWRPFSFQAHGNHPLRALLINPAREACHFHNNSAELKPVILLSSWWRDSVMKMPFRNTVIGLCLSIGIAQIIVSLVVFLNGIGLW